MGFLDELISGIKTGKEASVFLGKNADGFVAVKVYTDLRVRSFKRDASYREGRFIGDSRIEKAIRQGSRDRSRRPSDPLGAGGVQADETSL